MKSTCNNLEFVGWSYACLVYTYKPAGLFQLLDGRTKHAVLLCCCLLCAVGGSQQLLIYPINYQNKQS